MSNCCNPAHQGIIPWSQPLGFDGDGKTYRVNSDSVAVAVADALSHKTHFHHHTRWHLPPGPAHPPDAGGGPGRDSGESNAASPAGDAFQGHSRLSRLPRPGSSVFTSSMPRDEGLLAEVFSNEGIGTLVYANE